MVVERLSWIGLDSSRRGSLWSIGKGEFSKRLSSISLPSVGVLCASESAVMTLRSSADFTSNPEQKMSNDISSGIDKSRLDAKRRKNLAHAAPMDSFSNCSKLRMSIGREYYAFCKGE
jgi:hypothetical protein